MAYDENSPVDVNAGNKVIAGADLTGEFTQQLNQLYGYRREYGYLLLETWATSKLGTGFIPDTAIQGTHITAAMAAIDALFTVLNANGEAHWKALVTFAERGK
jgi:hypothetical protein